MHIQITIFQLFHNDDSNESLGSALARFERSTLEEHEGTRTVVLRFLEIITPVKCVMPLYDGYIGQPTEGELYRRSHHNTTIIKDDVWSVNIDKPRRGIKHGLLLLWDATDML